MSQPAEVQQEATVAEEPVEEAPKEEVVDASEATPEIAEEEPKEEELGEVHEAPEASDEPPAEKAVAEVPAEEVQVPAEIAEKLNEGEESTAQTEVR
ncbi:hypothetical protein TRFO_07862 [Tritrichomonas foetus]|uniref:Uncharacterized protein n=1 Tax=Tritrichomonas foetus TaxID=1144522 RepID=A0A1J4JN93_9EUKA|nr:hypothetical protein TRFO_07862 [Tritrichomonas foetus]|eukprot:OHT00547.1 hypothetical protein TRFO_07862 [Tritrichomonas foetus]